VARNKSCSALNSVRGELSVRVAPVAKFSFSPAAPRPGRTVFFTDESTGTPTSLEWNFGDGARSTEDWPSHVYTRVGTYTVTLTARNLSGQSTVTHTVRVASPDTGTGDAYTYLVPVVLTSAGAGGTFFSTELTLTNGPAGRSTSRSA
jgi:PKD repeat protein